MARKTLNELLSSTNAQKVLSFLVDNPSGEFLPREIQKATSLSRAGVYIALSNLVKQKIVNKSTRGKVLLYSLRYEEPLAKQFKVMKNIILLRPLIEKLKAYSKRILIYGSASRGEDSVDSDIDIFVLTHDSLAVRKTITATRIKRKIQAVVKTPSEFAEFKDKEKVFWSEVERGIVLWEKKL
jgi:predicted nucleotidyltransferase